MSARATARGTGHGAGPRPPPGRTASHCDVDLLERIRDGQGRPVDVARGQRLERHPGHRDDPGKEQRDVVAGQANRIASPVEALVVVLDAVSAGLRNSMSRTISAPRSGAGRTLAWSESLRYRSCAGLGPGLPDQPDVMEHARIAQGGECRCGSDPSPRNEITQCATRPLCPRVRTDPWSPPRPPRPSASGRARCSHRRTGTKAHRATKSGDNTSSALKAPDPSRDPQDGEQEADQAVTDVCRSGRGEHGGHENDEQAPPVISFMTPDISSALARHIARSAGISGRPTRRMRSGRASSTC